MVSVSQNYSFVTDHKVGRCASAQGQVQMLPISTPPSEVPPQTPKSAKKAPTAVGLQPGRSLGSLASAEIEAAALLETGSPMQRFSSMRRTASSTQQAAQSIFTSYVSRRFMSGCAILLPMVLTLYITFWFIEFFDHFFSPIYYYLFGFHVFGLGFITSMLFIFATGVFTSSWIGSLFVGMGEWTIRKVPLVKHIYSAAKQVSAAVAPDSDSKANSFRECVIIRHPRRDGEFAFGFITGSTVLQTVDDGDIELFIVYVPTNHVYVGDVFLIGERDIIRSGLSVREGIEIVVSVGMAIPPKILQLQQKRK